MTNNSTTDFPIKPVRAGEDYEAPALADVIPKRPPPTREVDIQRADRPSAPRTYYAQENFAITVEAQDALDDLKRSTGKSKKELHGEALNLLFQKYSLPQVG